jgi:hypothetical protein
MSIGGIVGVVGIETEKINNKRENFQEMDEMEMEKKEISRNQREVVDFYYKIKEYLLQNSELCSQVPSKRKEKRISWMDEEDEYGYEYDEWENNANVQLNLKISEAFNHQTTAPIPIPPPNDIYYRK